MLLRNLLFLGGNIAAGLDETSIYAQKLPWPVDIKQPKAPFINVEKQNVPAPWCKYGLMEIMSKALFLDEQTSLTQFEALTNFTSDLYRQFTTGPHRPGGEALPVIADVEDTPQGKLRTLFTSLVLATKANESDLSKIIAAYGALPDREHQRAFTQQLVLNAGSEDSIFDRIMTSVNGALAKVRASFQDKFGMDANPLDYVEPRVRQIIQEVADYTPGILDGVPDTVVGFMSSRAMTEFLAELFSDNFADAFTTEGRAGASLGSALCRAVGIARKIDYLPEITTCSLLSVAFYVLTCTHPQTSCPASGKWPENIKYTADDCELIDDEFKAKRPIRLSYLPRNEAIDLTQNKLSQAGIKNDGPSIYYLQVADLNAYQVITQSWCQKPIDDPTFIKELIPGWKIVREVWLNEDNDGTSENAPTKVAPIGVLAKRDAVPADTNGECEFLITTRGTATAWEWYMNLHLSLTPIHYIDDVDTKGHTQYGNIALQLTDSWNEHLLQNHFLKDPSDTANYCDPNKTTLWLTGHSLGAGVVNMEALMMAYYWKQKLGFANMTVNTLGLASMRVFNEKANQLYAELVNQRSIRFEADTVPSVGCPGAGVPRCNPEQFPASLHGEGTEDMEPELPGLIVLEGKRDFYDVDERLGYFADHNFLSINTGLSEITNKFENVFVNIPIQVQMGNSHICSYRCYISRFCSKDPHKQTLCNRGTVNKDTPINCFDKEIKLGQWFGNEASWLGSLDCTHNEPNEPPKDADPRQYVCNEQIPGISGSMIWNMINPSKVDHEEL